MGNISENLAGANHHAQIRRLIPNDVGKAGTRLENFAETGDMSRHTTEIEPGHTGIHPLKGGLQTVITGGLAAGAAFLIAKLIS